MESKNKTNLEKNISSSFIKLTKIQQNIKKEPTKENKCFDVIRREDYEIDPRSSFRRLKNLQNTLKEESSFRELFLKNKNEIFKEIDLKCHEYFQYKLKIKELYDNENSRMKQLENEIENTEKENEEINNVMHYELSENSQTELPQCQDPLYKLLFLFRENNQKMLDLINVVDPSFYEDLSNIICHFFYIDIFNSNPQNESLLLLIYLLLDKEIDQIQNVENSSSFLNGKNFLFQFFKNLTRKNEVLNYLFLVLDNLISEFFNIDNKYNKENSFISIEISKIKVYVKENLSKIKEVKGKKISDINKFLLEENDEEEEEDNEILNENEENTKKDKKNLINSFYEHDNEKYFNKSDLFKKYNSSLYQTVENYYLNSEFFDKNDHGTSKNKNNISEEKQNIFSDLDKNVLNELLKNEKNQDMQKYINRQIKFLENEKNIFSLSKFITELTSKDKEQDKTILLYKYSYDKIKKYLDIFKNDLFKNNNNIPYIIKYISIIITRLLQIKFKNISIFEINSFIGKFFFENLIFPILNDPSYNCLLKNYNKNIFNNELKNEKISIFSKVLSKLISGDFFGNNQNDNNYLIFNYYFLKIMPDYLNFFDNLSNVEIPNIIEKLLSEKKENKKYTIIDYEYFKENPDEQIENQSICITWTDYLIFYNTIKSNENIFFNEDTKSNFYKTYKKLTYHEETMKTKIKNDTKNNIKTYIFLTKNNFNNKISTLFQSFKNQKFSFQTNEEMRENENELFILERVKFSICTIIKHLNTLTRANFEESDKNLDFVFGLNKVLQLEGFSEILKEKTIPLSWYSLYLTSNIENIPSNYKRSNYNELYVDLEKNSTDALKSSKNDEILNYVYSKLKISEKLIDIEKNKLTQLEIERKKKLIEIFIKYTNIPVCIQITHNINDAIESMTIIQLDRCENDKAYGRKNSKRDSRKPTKKDKKNPIKDKDKNKKHIHCMNINEFINNFPSLVTEADVVEIFEYEKGLYLDRFFNNYFAMINEEISVNDIFNLYEEKELQNIKKEIINYIYRNLYDKIYPEMVSKNDIILYQQSIMLEWIKSTNFNKDFDILEINILDIAKNYFAQMDNAHSPYDKIGIFSKIVDIVVSCLKFSEFNTEEIFNNPIVLNLLLYVSIKAQPYRLDSNFNYITLFLYNDILNPKIIHLLTFMHKFIYTLLDFSYSNLVGITEEEFNNNKLKETKVD